MNKQQLEERKKHLLKLKRLYKGNTISKSLVDWNNNFKEEYTKINNRLKETD